MYVLQMMRPLLESVKQEIDQVILPMCPVSPSSDKAMMSFVNLCHQLMSFVHMILNFWVKYCFRP